MFLNRHLTNLLIATIFGLLTLFPFSLLTTSCRTNGGSSLNPQVAKKLREILIEKMEEFHVPGALVGVWIPGHGNLIIEEGVSDIQTGKPISKLDHVRIGSVTKSFTVTVLLQLVDEGFLSLDDPLKKFFPDIQNSDATVRELATMTSGIFNYTEDTEFVLELLDDLLRKWSPFQLIDVAGSNAPYFPPGGGWHYSNTNTVILGTVIEQITGHFIGDEIRNRIIEPLGLNGTIYPTTPDMPEPFSRGYGLFDPDVGLEDITLSDPSSSAGSGAIVSRLEDLKRWGEALGKGTLLTVGTQKERIDSLMPIVFDPCDDDDPDRPKRSCPEYDRYGSGIGELSGWIGHTGDYLGYQALVMFRPDTNATVVILINLKDFTNPEHIPTVIFREYAEILK